MSPCFAAFIILVGQFSAICFANEIGTEIEHREKRQVTGPPPTSSTPLFGNKQMNIVNYIALVIVRVVQWPN